MTNFVKLHILSSYKKKVGLTYPLKIFESLGTTGWNSIKKAMQKCTVFAVIHVSVSIPTIY